MRFLILSDIHANLEALEALLEAAPPTTFDRLLVLGDLVGYGASPNEVVDRIFDLKPYALIRGNHDKAASGVEPPHHFNEVAAAAALWTLKTLTPANRQRIAALPPGPVMVDERIEICHGTPLDEDVYVFDQGEAYRALDGSKRPLCFFGHTHVAGAFVRTGVRVDTIAPPVCCPDALDIPINDTERYLINPGSVGQPRDGDPRAAYATYDSETGHVRLCRVPYRVDMAQQKILSAGLPDSLARRLGVGR